MKPLRAPARIAVAALGVFALLELVIALATVGYGVALDELERATISSAEVRSLRDGIVALHGLALLAFALTALAFLTWFRRAYANLARSGRGEVRFSPGWALGAWLVPVLNLWRPKQLADDLWRAGAPAAAGGSPRPEVSPLVHWWWGLWLAGLLAAAVAALIAPGGELGLGAADLDRERSAVSAGVLAALLLMGAAVLAALLVRSVTRRQGTEPGSRSVPEPVPSAPPPARASREGPIVESDAGRWRCAFCGWVFTNPAAAGEHASTHHRVVASADSRSE